MRVRAEAAPGIPVRDARRAVGRDPIESVRDSRELRDRDLAVGLDLLVLVERDDRRAARIVEKEGEGVKDRRTGRTVAIRERGEEPPDVDREAGLLLRLAYDGVEDRLVLVDAAGRGAGPATRVEGLCGQEDGGRRPA